MLPDKLHPISRPPHRLIRRKEMLRRLGVGYDTVLAWTKSGEFPQPVRLGPRIIAWIESEVDAFIDSLPRGISDFRPNSRCDNDHNPHPASDKCERPCNSAGTGEDLKHREGVQDSSAKTSSEIPVEKPSRCNRTSGPIKAGTKSGSRKPAPD